MVEVFVPKAYCSKTFWPPEDNPSPTVKSKMNDKVIQPFNIQQLEQPHYIRLKNGHLGASPVCRANAAKSMDLLRAVLQPAINSDLIEVLQKYILVFKEAAENACENMTRGPFNSTSNSLDVDAMVAKVCQDTLENAMSLFSGNTKEKLQQKANNNPKRTIDSQNLDSIPPTIPSHVYHGKRRAASPDFPWQRRLKVPGNEKAQRRSLSPVPKKRPRNSTPLVTPRRYGSPHRNPKEAIRKKIESWDPSTLTTERNFVMGTRANRALGLGATRGRIYMKHPELFKYSSDHEDKKWMVKHNCMAATGGKNAFIMLADDVVHLYDTEYKDSPGIMPEELQFFKLPELVLKKMQRVMAAEKKHKLNEMKSKLEDSSPLSVSKEVKSINISPTKTIHLTASRQVDVRQAAQAAATAITASASADGSYPNSQHNTRQTESNLKTAESSYTSENDSYSEDEADSPFYPRA